MPRAIVHLDADAFFAACEQSADARLRGKPIAVGGEQRGIIASASYEARKFGIYTPMPTSKARKLCPKLIVLPGDFERYEQFSRWMFSYAYDFTPTVEQSSIDEGYLDVTANRKSPTEIAETLRHAIRDSLKLTVSEGLGANKLVSQIASKLHKPAGFCVIQPGQEISFLHPLPNRWLPSVGPKTSERLLSAGLAYVRQIAGTSTDLLFLLVGQSAPQLKDFSNGIDERPVVPASAPAKSFSQQQTFGVDQTDEVFLEATLRRMADHLMAAVREEKKSIRTLTVKVRYNDMMEDQSSESLVEPTDLETDIYVRTSLLLRKAWKRRVSLRMISLKLSNVYEGIFRCELPLAPAARNHEARRRLATIVDDLRRAHGHRVIFRGHDFVLSSGEPSRDCELPPQTRSPASRYFSKRSGGFVPLNVHSCYSFLDSTLSINALIELAQRYEFPSIAVTDTANLHGAVEFVQAAENAGIKPILGAEIFIESSPLRLYVENSAGYSNLCRILSTRRASGEVEETSIERRMFRTHEIEPFTDGLIAVSANPSLDLLFPGRFYLEATVASSRLNSAISRKLPSVACPAIHYAERSDRWKWNVVQSIRTRTLLHQAHPQKQLEGDFHFWTPSELRESLISSALAHTVEIAERCQFKLPLGNPQFPPFSSSDGSSPTAFLRKLVFQGLSKRYPLGRAEVVKQIEEELSIIREVGYEEYFLVVWDILQECKAAGIEWLTRGSAADSLVCYCLGISDVCPVRFNLYFRRFLNKDRMLLQKLPDIDVDFPHDRKDDVVDLIFRKYGTSHTAVVGGFSTYQPRSALGDVAKVLGVSESQIRRVTERFPYFAGLDKLSEAVATTPDCAEVPLQEEPYRTALQMAQFLHGFPRHPKMHPCGVVLSRQPMAELTPTFISSKGYPTTHFDMESVEAIGLIKMDILAQGGLAVMRDAKETLRSRGISINLESLEPWEDPQVWEMIATGNARAVHHIESPAMVGLCKMANVRDIDVLIAVVSVIRPGAANECNKVEFTRRTQGLSPILYPHSSLESCLKDTFGLIVYEEHILQICESFAGLPAGRADVLRRALAKEKVQTIAEIAKEFSECARALGRTPEEISRVWGLVSSFSGYAFCKAHSTAYGVEAYEGAWLKRYYPVEFMAGVLSNGKGFYHPLVYVLECHRVGIPLMPPWINQPGPQFTVENGAIRVPATRTKGLTERTTKRILEERQRGAFESLAEFYRRVAPQPEEMELLQRVGAFDGFGKTRAAQFWEIQMLLHTHSRFEPSGQGWLFPPETDRLPATPLEEPTEHQRLRWELELLHFPVSAHPLKLYPNIAWETYCPVSELGRHIGQEVVTCGLVIEQRIHHQVTGEPMKFLTLCDWTGMIETELFAKTYRAYGLATVRYPVLEITATVEPFENGRGFSLRVHRAAKPRQTHS